MSRFTSFVIPAKAGISTSRNVLLRVLKDNIPAFAGMTMLIVILTPLTASAEIPNIIIYALRTPVPLNQVASSVTVITSDDIERENKPTVTELLRQVPGMTVASDGSVGQRASVFVRGANSNHVLVVMDGVTLNDPSNPSDAFDFSNLTTDNIERIEILRGPQSTLYGSQAIGGVINIISKKGRGAPGYNASAEVGSFSSRKESVGASGETGKTSYSLQAANSHTGGVSALAQKFGGQEKDGSDNYSLSANVQSRLTDRFTAKLNARYNRTNTQFDNPNSFLSLPADYEPSENDSRQFNARATGELSLFDGKWTQELGVSYLRLTRAQMTEFFDSSFNAYFGHQEYVSWREMADWLHHFKILPNNTLTLGGEIASDHYKLNGIPQIALGELNVDRQAVFIDDQFTVGENFFMNAGIRNDYHQAFGRNTTWKLAPGYKIAATNTTLKATYGLGFKAPSLYSLYDSTYGNPALNPERSRGYDFGFEQPFAGGRVKVGATWFRNNIKNLLDTVETSPGSGVYKYVNIGKARTQGLETQATWNPAPEWTMTGAYTFTQADNILSDVQLRRRPRHQFNLSQIYQYSPDGDVGMNVRHVGSRRDADLNFVLTDTKAFTTVDLYANYKLNPTVTLYGRLDNVFDTEYQEVFGYGQPGRSVFVGTKADF